MSATAAATDVQRRRLERAATVTPGRAACSSPTVSPGREPTWRTASRTPGMKLTRSNESCRMVSCSPALPSRISSCATSPRSRTECTRTPSTSAPRAPSSACVVASGTGPRPAAARAAAIAEAVCRAVPDGASTLSGWCSSITSTDSNQRAARAANAMARTAPSAKFGATSTPTPGRSARWSRTRASESSSQPVVPTTRWTPASTSACTLPSVADGTVKSTATCAPASTTADRSASASTAATSSRSGASCTARTTV